MFELFEPVEHNSDVSSFARLHSLITETNETLAVGKRVDVAAGGLRAVGLKPGAPLELFDLPDDPYEARDVAAKHADVVAKIEAYLRTARTPSDRWPAK